jgi:hypothetical protein
MHDILSDIRRSKKPIYETKDTSPILFIEEEKGVLITPPCFFQYQFVWDRCVNEINPRSSFLQVRYSNNRAS